MDPLSTDGGTGILFKDGGCLLTTRNIVAEHIYRICMQIWIGKTFYNGDDWGGRGKGTTGLRGFAREGKSNPCPLIMLPLPFVFDPLSYSRFEIREDAE